MFMGRGTTAELYKIADSVKLAKRQLDTYMIIQLYIFHIKVLAVFRVEHISG